MSKSLAVAALALAAVFFSQPAKAQQSTLVCVTTSQPPLIHIEGLAERVGDVVFDCSGGTPNGQLQLDLTLFLNVNVTNRINAANETDAVITTDSGSGPVAMPVPGVLVAANTVSFDGVPVPFSSTGTVQIRIAGVRANATQLAAAAPFVYASIAVNGQTIPSITQSMIKVAQALTSVYSSELVGSFPCSQSGSAPATSASFHAFLAKPVPSYTIRVTEAYAYALAAKNSPQSRNADTGTRILLTWRGAPSATVFYLPDVIAGSNAVETTSAGAYGIPVSGGKYDPSSHSLLLARVYGADAQGAGGTPAYEPGAPGSGAVSFDKLGPVATTHGSAYAVYEVVDSAETRFERAYVPVFVTYPSIYDGLTYTITDQVALAPVSSVAMASRTAPIPRFSGTPTPSDCLILKDCVASTTPTILSVTSSADFSEGTVVPGSLATIMGSNLKANKLVVGFDGIGAEILYQDSRQINVRVPNEVAGMARTQMKIDVDGQLISTVVDLQPFSPGVFPAAVLNQNNALNSPATPAHPGTVIQIWGTGMTAGGVVTANMGGQPIGEPAWWGPAPGIPGVQQVNLKLPDGLQFTDNTTTFSICEASPAAPGQKRCSPERPLNVSQ